MTSALSTRSGAGRSATRPVATSIGVGALTGLAASVVMAGYAMIASATYQHHGFFTPLYHIASLFVAPTDLMSSMAHAMTGDTYYVSSGTALLGAALHMMTGAMYGAAFGAIVAMLRFNRGLLPLAGALWGALVFVISTYVGLPLAAAIFNSGDQITHMARMVGYGTFLLEHVLFGLALGLLLTIRRTASR